MQRKLMENPLLRQIRQRDALLRQTRRFFYDRGFLEAQVPCLSRDCVVDAYLDPIRIPSSSLGLPSDDDSLPSEFFLQTSPESALKRLLCQGAPSLFSIGPVFRQGELGARHNLEFTMLEWYELDADMEAGVATLGELACELLDCQRCDRVTYRDLFANEFGWDPLDCPLSVLQESTGKIDRQLTQAIGQDRDAMLDVLFTEKIEPGLGRSEPVIVIEYPASQAALAKRSQRDPQTACRFELFYRGLELANGYDELLDPEELKQRYRDSNLKRLRDGRQALSEETSLVTAMQSGMPPCSGVALGVERLLMAKHGYDEIASVMPFTMTTA